MKNYRQNVEESLRRFWRPGDVLRCLRRTDGPKHICELCGYQGIRWNYHLQNQRTNQVLIVGSRCIWEYKKAAAAMGQSVDIFFPAQLTAQAERLNRWHPGTVLLESIEEKTHAV